MTTEEWRLKNYLNNHDIYKDDSNMQTVIINSFVNDNNMAWKDKLIYCQKHFSKFAMYSHNNWKHDKIHSN